MGRLRKKNRVRFDMSSPDSTDNHSLRGVVAPLAGVPVAMLEAERRLLLGALQRTLDANDSNAEAAARRCIAAVEDEILGREGC
jgi:hypothetical protein